MTKKTTTPSKEEEETAKDEVVQKINSIKVLAAWKSFTPDVRPYKPSTPVIEFPEPLIVMVRVPLTADLIDNASVISIAQMTNQAEPRAQFTPLGMRHIIDQFESAMKNGEPEAEETAKADDEDWGDDEEEKPVKKETKKSAPADDEWDEEDTSDKSDKDADFEEDWNE